MNLAEMEIKIRENKKVKGLEAARFALTYTEKNHPEGSFEILSTLKGPGDVIVELNSNYINVAGLDKEMYFDDLINKIIALKLQYKLRKVPVIAREGLFSFLTRPRETQAEELLLYLPNQIWSNEEFQRLFPIYSARYYLMGGKIETISEEISSKQDNLAAGRLEKLSQLTDQGKLDYFSLIIFDPGDLPMMGINSLDTDLKALKNLLKVS